MAIDTKNMRPQVFNWGPCVVGVDIPMWICDKLVEEGRKSDYDGSEFLAGHIKNQHQFSPETQKWIWPEFLPVFKMYRAIHCQYHRIPNLPVTFEPDSLWINFQKANEFNPHHIHIGDLSFVLYCKIPKEMEEEQKNFKGTAMFPGEISWEFTQQARPRWATTGMSHFPREGEMFIFPAMLQHWVAPFKTPDVERISVSGNMSCKFHPTKEQPTVTTNYF